MLSELEYSLDKEHIIIKDVICSFAKIGSLDGDKNSQHRLDGNIKKLQEIYKNTDFRHKYSKIFLIISSIDKVEKTNSGNILSINDLMHSMEIAYEYILSSNEYKDGFKKCFCKLYDHVVLEILQINYMREIENKGDANNATTMKELRCAMSLAKTASDNADKATDKLNGMQKDYITILGIFAAIILAFVSGLVFSNSVLQSIDKASIYRLIAVISLIAIFIVNILNFLFSFIKQIHYGKDDKSSKFKSLNSFNIIMLLIIILTAVAWYFYHPYEHKTTTNSTTTININASDLANCRAK
jgi:hypothetical protein|nr:MAG TPA: hypothetical protein [Caudoviricetes sp.]